MTHVRTHTADGVLTITLDREDKKNALTIAMYESICAAFETARTDPNVRVLVLQGSEQCFTSGNDIADFMQSPPTGEDTPVFRFLTAIRTFEKPLVAAVAGAAVGVGTTLLLHCDLVVVARNARLQMPFTRLALVPEAGSSLLVPRIVGHRHAARLLMLGEAIDAEDALAMGLASHVVADGEALGTAARIAADLAALPPSALRITKQLLKRAEDPALEARMAEEGALFVERLGSPEATEAFSAFMERRKPDFSSF